MSSSPSTEATRGETQQGFARLKLLIAYDGRPFRGWQSQASGDAVQDFIEKAFAAICGERVVVHGSGRTDAGVHALGQVAHADVPRGLMPARQWMHAINANLPREIRVLRSTGAAANFEARFQATGKLYTYRIWNASVLHPLELGRVWHMPVALDLATLRRCAALFVGTHDFASFAANRQKREAGTVRTIRRLDLSRRGALVTLRFEGDGFLYKMVRLLTGTLVRCANGRDSPSLISELLANPGKRKSNYVAPAEGLYLTRVLY